MKDILSAFIKNFRCRKQLEKNVFNTKTNGQQCLQHTIVIHYDYDMNPKLPIAEIISRVSLVSILMRFAYYMLL